MWHHECARSYGSGNNYSGKLRLTDVKEMFVQMKDHASPSGSMSTSKQVGDPDHLKVLPTRTLWKHGCRRTIRKASPLKDLFAAEVAAIGDDIEARGFQRRFRLLGHVGELRPVGADVGHLMRDDQMMLGVYGDLDVVAYDARAPAARRNRAARFDGGKYASWIIANTRAALRSASRCAF
jgi:hypothetical protein